MIDIQLITGEEARLTENGWTSNNPSLSEYLNAIDRNILATEAQGSWPHPLLGRAAALLERTGGRIVGQDVPIDPIVEGRVY